MKADTPKTYRLVELRAENYMKLKAVSVKIDGTVLKVNGRNEQGKSALLGAVASAIAGPKAFPAEPVRKGEDRAEIFLDFGGLKLTRKIWHKEGGGIDHSLVLEYADGKRPREKQTVLDQLRGSPIADDPIAFSKLKPDQRYNLLKKLVPDFDFEDHAQKRLDLFEDRTQVGRELDRAKAAAASITTTPGTVDSVDVTELATALRGASEANAEIDRRAVRREGFADELETMRDRADQLAAELRTLQSDIAAREKKISEAEPLPAKVDVTAIQTAIAGAEKANEEARKRRDKMVKLAEAEQLEASYDLKSTQIKAMDEAKAKVIENAKLPIPELTFGDGDILLDNLPFDQASTARKIRVSTALLMALKPELRVLLVREGSLLDDDARAALEADAKANDFVVLLETVGPGDGSGILIEDGEIV